MPLGCKRQMFYYLLQEHKLKASEINSVKLSIGKYVWCAAFAPRIRCPGGGRSAGVAVLAAIPDRSGQSRRGHSTGQVRCGCPFYQ